jgi:pSer/pThr/pTyr-binding forkhead associated (FHA) protein
VARLIQTTGGGAQEHLFAGPIRVGRDKGLTIPLDDPKCSREHTFFYVTEENGKRVHWVRDLGSRNGTQLNNQKLTAPTRLADADVVRVGGTDFTFRFDPGEAPPPAPKPVISRKPLRAEPPRTTAAGAMLRILILIGAFAAATFATKILAARYIASMFT